MQSQKTYVITGAAGFIASYLVGFLNRQGIDQLILVDDFSRPDKAANLANKKYLQKIERSIFFDWLKTNTIAIDGVFHLGARTDTTEMNYAIHDALNVVYSQQIWNWCAEKNIPLVYASSAATYGNGELGYIDDHKIVDQLKPLNPYGVSKNNFDAWALQQTATPPFYAGVKFFNVYGPNEYHKGRMASVIMHAFNQIQSKGSMTLFKSHHPDFKDGEQIRDFIYVKDIVSICVWLMEHQPTSGLYNAGTGEGRTFVDLAKGLFSAINKPADIQFIDTPIDIRDKYQYFTQADTKKLRAAGYPIPFTSLEDGIKEYVTEFLLTKAYF
ncbi:MAG: ADP-glyceromanno-heptose 6-epimerase [Bacteroidota bacterium]|jgi:ADP-L-glycero-D-manno-heptose 6-epimerase|nr:ADP-glyceromanno-heptose 6-epimerase [Bacteroidota bacterium]